MPGKNFDELGVSFSEGQFRATFGLNNSKPNTVIPSVAKFQG
jgi:hypothetical protein